MCARYTLRRRDTEWARLFLARLGLNWESVPPLYNIAPSQPVPVVATDERGQLVVRLMRWGLVPHWAKDVLIGAKLINARIETVKDKPSFRDAMKYRRCLIPADGFYEWTAGPGGRRQPYFIHRIDDGVLAFAGLWEHWQDAHGNELESCTILTTAANDTVRPLHDRMPVILDPAHSTGWIQAPSADEALAFIQESSDTPELTMHAVSRHRPSATLAHDGVAWPFPKPIRDYSPNQLKEMKLGQLAELAKIRQKLRDQSVRQADGSYRPRPATSEEAKVIAFHDAIVKMIDQALVPKPTL